MATAAADVAAAGGAEAEAAPGSPGGSSSSGTPRGQERALQRAHRPARTVSNYPARPSRSTAAASPDGRRGRRLSGLNSLLPLSEDEQVTWNLVRSVRGRRGGRRPGGRRQNLRRALLLTLQLGQLEVPTVLVLNMHDEAEARGIRVDLPARGGARRPVRTPWHRGWESRPDRGARVRPCARNHLPVPEEWPLPPSPS